MGQSVKDAFGVDMSGISVAALESDAGLREHLFMACVAEMASRGSADALEDTPDAVYACAKGLFGAGEAALGVSEFLSNLHEDARYEVHREHYDVLCAYLDFVSDYLGVDSIPKYVTSDWFFEHTSPFVEFTSDDLDAFLLDCRDQYWVWLSEGNFGEYILWPDGNALNSGSVAAESGRSCVGATDFHSYAVKWFDYKCPVLEEYKDVDADTWGYANVPRTLYDYLPLLLQDPYVDDPDIAVFMAGIFMQLFFNIRFLCVNVDLFDFELVDICKGIIGRKDFLSSGEVGYPPRLCLVYVLDGPRERLFVEHGFSDLRDKLCELGVSVLGDDWRVFDKYCS